MSVRFIFMLVMLLMHVHSSAQFYPKGQDYRLGVTFGLTPSTLLGTELEKPRLKFGIQSGIYYRTKIAPKSHVEVNFGAALRGSKFKHNDDDFYDRLNFVVVEMPLFYMYDLKKKEEKTFLIAGIAPTAILQSEFYIVPELTARDSLRDFGIRRWDLAAIAGFHVNTYYTGLRITAQYGLINLNDGLVLQGIKPETGKGGSIQSFAVNLQIYF